MVIPACWHTFEENDIEIQYRPCPDDTSKCCYYRYEMALNKRGEVLVLKRWMKSDLPPCSDPVYCLFMCDSIMLDLGKIGDVPYYPIDKIGEYQVMCLQQEREIKYYSYDNKIVLEMNQHNDFDLTIELFNLLGNKIHQINKICKGSYIEFEVENFIRNEKIIIFIVKESNNIIARGIYINL